MNQPLSLFPSIRCENITINNYDNRQCFCWKRIFTRDRDNVCGVVIVNMYELRGSIGGGFISSRNKWPASYHPESSTLPFKKCKFVNASNGGVKICSLSPCQSLRVSFSLFLLDSARRTLLPVRLLSNTKNQIKYAKLRFEDFGELGTAEGS